MVCAEQPVDPWEMHGEVLVESGRFRTVVPVMKARRANKRFPRVVDTRIVTPRFR